MARSSFAAELNGPQDTISECISLGDMIEEMQTRGGVWFATMEEIANHVQACIDDGSWKPRIDELPYYGAPISELKDRALA